MPAQVLRDPRRRSKGRSRWRLDGLERQGSHLGQHRRFCLTPFPVVGVLRFHGHIAEASFFPLHPLVPPLQEGE